MIGWRYFFQSIYPKLKRPFDGGDFNSNLN
jgi:hypothetical protein